MRGSNAPRAHSSPSSALAAALPKHLVLTHFYGFSVDASVAVAVLFHIIGTLPVLAMGLFLFAKEGVRLRDVSGKS